MRRRMLINEALSFVFALMLVSCTRSTAQNKDTLVVALSASPSTLDPRFATDANGMRIDELLFNSLVRVGPKLQVVGDAAAQWSFDEKKKIYTFELHPGLKFSNGRAVTAEDIKFSFQEYKKATNPFHSALQIINKVEVNTVGDHLETKLYLRQFSAKLLNSDLPVVKILPKKEVLQYGEDFSDHLVGTGSFRLVQQTANDIRLEARFDHSFAPPKIRYVLFKIIRNDFTLYQKTLSGGVDIAQSEVPLDKVSEFEKRSDQFDVVKSPGLSMSYILINLKDPMLKRLPVRQALAQAINRKQIIQYKLKGLAQVATSLLTPNNPFFDSSLSNLPYSVSDAKKRLAGAHILHPKLILKTSNNPSAIENGRVIANQLRQAGFDVSMQSYEWGTFYSDLHKGNFQLATMKWVGALDPDIYRIAFDSKEWPPGRNRGFYKNAQVDKMVHQGLLMANEQKRIGFYKKVQEIIQHDLPIIPLWYEEQVAIVNKRVKNYVPSQTGDFTGLINASKAGAAR